MPSTDRQPTGRFAISFCTFSLVALLLGFATELMGVFDGGNSSLRAMWENLGISFSASTGVNQLSGFLIALVSILGLVAAVLGTPGDGRRVILGFSALALALALAPVFAVWGIFWKPFGLFLGLFWAWFSAFLYARTHRMPCEGAREKSAQNVIPIKGNLPPKSRSARSDG